MKTLKELFESMKGCIIIGQAHSLGYTRQITYLETLKECEEFIEDYGTRSELHSIAFIIEDEKTFRTTTETFYIK